jgi:hypothetical protein
MELSIPANKIDTRNVYFMEKKKNIIVDGDFAKILYSTAEFEMNGLYIFAEFETTQENKFQNWTRIQSKPSANVHQKKYIAFNPSTIENACLIELLCKIESSIIERYINNYCPKKIASYALKTQISNGIIKYHSENKLVDYWSIGTIPKQIGGASIVGGRTLTTQEFEIDARVNNERETLMDSPTKQYAAPSSVSLQLRLQNHPIPTLVLRSCFAEGIDQFRRQNITGNEYLSTCKTTDRIILKISGVWETSTHVGITMKFISSN